jgi:hypothetical protein
MQDRSWLNLGWCRQQVMAVGDWIASHDFMPAICRKQSLPCETNVLKWMLKQQPCQIYMWQKLQLLCTLMCEQLLKPWRWNHHDSNVMKHPMTTAHNRRLESSPSPWHPKIKQALSWLALWKNMTVILATLVNKRKWLYNFGGYFQV